MKKDFLRNFTKVKGKYLCQSLSKKETLAQMFSYEFCEISKNTFFTENHRATASSFLYLFHLVILIICGDIEFSKRHNSIGLISIALLHMIFQVIST